MPIVQGSIDVELNDEQQWIVSVSVHAARKPIDVQAVTGLPGLPDQFWSYSNVIWNPPPITEPLPAPGIDVMGSATFDADPDQLGELVTWWLIHGNKVLKRVSVQA